MGEFWKTIAAFLFGAGGLAIINVVQERWKIKQERKAKKEDKAEEKEDKFKDIEKAVTELQESTAKKSADSDEQFRELKSMQVAQSEALKLILLDRILYLGQSYIARGEVSFDDRKRLHAMHDCYHHGLRGNGDADLVMEGVDALPLKK